MAQVIISVVGILRMRRLTWAELDGVCGWT